MFHRIVYDDKEQSVTEIVNQELDQYTNKYVKVVVKTKTNPYVFDSFINKLYNVNPIDVPFRGRTLKVAGDRTFDPWTVTIINDENFRLRTAFEKWMNHINKLENATGATDPNSYMVDAYVYQLGRGSSKESTSNFSDANGGPLTPLRTYKFYQIFPTNVSQIDLSYDTADDIETYTVEFQILYWTAGETTADQAGSTNIIK
jgi:hypothetical protein